MSMDKINGSPLHRPGMLDRFAVSNNKEEETGNSAPVVSGEGRPNPAPTDRAEISDTAHQLIDLRAAVDVGRAALQDAPDVREERVALAKKRLEEGYYNSQVVQDRLSGILGNVLNKLDEI